jgi:hypothetical protein
MSINALSTSSALTLLTTNYSSSGGQTSNLSTGDKALKSNPTFAGMASSSDFFFVGRVSQNAVMTTVVNTGKNIGNQSAQTVAGYESGVQQQANTYLSENEMTSQQVSDAIYSDQGISGGISTMAGEINAMNASVNFLSQDVAKLTTWVAAGMPSDENMGNLSNDTPDQINSMIATEQNQIATESANAAGIATAFQNGTLTIQKATDVQGLDYSETVWNSTNGNGSSAGLSQSYSQAFLNAAADGKNHMLTTIGNVAVYLTW